MRLTNTLAVAAMLMATAASADIFGCDHTAQRRVSSPLDGITKIKVIGRAGTLRVTGQAGVGQAVASGTACASDKDYLGDIQIQARREGTELTIEAIIPQRTMIFGWYEARLDLDVTVPADVALSVTDGSGSTRIEGTGPVSIVDGSGDVDVRGIRGKVDLRDGSGSVEIRNVTGDVSIVDGSGSVHVENVQGAVVVRADGSGSIDVSDIRGDFIVEADGSGGVHYERVSGRVRVPRDRD